MTITKKELLEKIRQDLNLGDTLSEAVIAQPKQFRLKTDLLSDANKQNHIELYEQYVTDFNRISIELDAVDRNNVSSNGSAYRSLKVDETYNFLKQLKADQLHQPQKQAIPFLEAFLESDHLWSVHQVPQ